MGNQGAIRILCRGVLVALILLMLILPLHPIAATVPFLLTEQEYTFIVSHPQVSIGVDPEFVPFEFIDNAGEYSGIAADIVALVSEITGIWFTPVMDIAWVDVVEMTKRKEIDVLSAVGVTSERLQYLQFSRPYITFQRTIVVKNTNQSISKLEDLYGRQVAVQTNSSHHGLLLEYPQIGIREYATVEEALLAVNRGEEIAFLGNEATTSYIARTNGLTELTFIPIETGGNIQLHFAVRDDWPLLVSIIDKALASIPDKQFTEIFNRWITYEKRVDYSKIINIAILTGLIVILAMGISVFWIMRLRKEIKHKELAQHAMEVAKAKAEAADQEKSRFMARMSHEIRTPLNGINGMTYLLERTGLDSTQRRFLQTIGQSTRSMLAIINDILDFSRIEERKITLEQVGFNLDSILQQVLSIDAWTVKEKNLNITLERGTTVPVHLIGDPNRLTQILTNLIHNAVKFTAQGGMKVAVRNLLEDETECHLEFTIRDTGMGMAPELLENLFKPFNQADESIARRFGGSGLGLSIVKSLVELMGGSTSVESKVGKGSTFTVALPFSLDKQRAAEERIRSESINFKALTALLVIQDEELMGSASGILASYGMRTDRVSTEKSALPLLYGIEEEGPRYSLLIMDAPSWKERPSMLLEAITSTTNSLVRPKTLLIVQNEEDSVGVDLTASTVDVVLPQPLIPSILYNAILELFPIQNCASMMVDYSPPVVRQLESYHVLVVEDNPTNQMIAREVLTQAGLRVTIANNGKEGVDQFLQCNTSDANGNPNDRLDVILMDLHMDVMDGYEATRLIRLEDDSIPIIATSADIFDAVQDRCTAVGITAIVSKPYDPDLLIQKIHELVDNGKSTESPGKASNAGIIDFEGAIKRLGGNRGLYAKVLDSFLTEHSNLAQLLCKQITQGLYADAVHTAHTLKGGCDTIGAHTAHKMAAQLQNVLEKGSAENITAQMKLFKREFSALLVTATKLRERI